MKKTVVAEFVAFLAILVLFAARASGQTVSGLWDATIKFDGDTIPFPIEFSQSESDLAASFFNGDKRVTSTAGKMTGNSIVLSFTQYGTQLKATLSQGEMNGTYGGTRDGLHAFTAKPHRQLTTENTQAPQIGGVWYIAPAAKDGPASRLVVKQKGAYLSASLVRVAGMTGPLIGGFEDGKFLLNQFDGVNASILQLLPKPDGTLAVVWKPAGKPAVHMKAVPLSDAIDDGLPGAAEPQAQPKPHDRL